MEGRVVDANMKVTFRIATSSDFFNPFLHSPDVLRVPDFRAEHDLEYALTNDTVCGTDASRALLVAILEGEAEGADVTFIVRRRR